MIDLHTLYQIEGTVFTDVYEPLEEGLDVVTEKRTISSLKIILTLDDPADLIGKPGYMPPVPEEEVDEEKFRRDVENYRRRKEGKSQIIFVM